MESSALKYGEYYHIYNRGNNGEALFKEPQNYIYFLTLYAKYINPIADTLAYCLMSNHFHIAIRIKDKQDIMTFAALEMFQEGNKIPIENKKPTPSAQFAHLFNTYSKTINKSFQRTGSLFEQPFERNVIETEVYLQRCIAYIHYNPIKAHLAKSYEDYNWSSFKSLISNKPTHLDRELVMKVFYDKEYFMQFHGSFDGNLKMP